MTQALRIAVVGGGPGGLYFSILMKMANPAHDIEVFERNQHDDTFGFGVVFSDETLDRFKAADPDSYRTITDAFAYWGGIDVSVAGQFIRSDGHGFAGMERKALLLILQERARDLGVKLHFTHDVVKLEDLGPRDLIVAADGINSAIRDRFKDRFKPEFDWRTNRFCWLGSTKSLPAFTFDFRENEHGVWILGAYQYKQGASTWVPECTEQTWKNAGLDQASEEQTVAYLQKLYADLLDGHPLITNRSIWRLFPMIRNERWYHDNIVLIGDALHTAHYSIGSGTKLAMEDAIALADSLGASADVARGLAKFEVDRKLEVEKTQHAADVSLVWFEAPQRFWKLEPMQLAFSLLSRSKQITYENLGRRDPAFVRRIDAWFAEKVEREQGVKLPRDPAPPPMFTPFALRDMKVVNRVAASPMNMYSAGADSVPGDFHLAHLGGFAMGGAGLVFVETTHISPESRITPGCVGIWNDTQMRGWKRIVDFTHANSDAKICLQIGHAGRKGSTRRGWEGMDLPLPDGNWPLVAPSPLPYRPESATPAEMDEAEMERVKAQFVHGARLAEQAGFDMLEVHMAHGYLLASFISPLTNRRTDRYGGSLEARFAYPLSVFKAARAVWPDHKPMSVRVSATDWAPGGLSDADSLEIAKMLKAAGCDLIDVSTGQTVHEQRPVYGRMYQVPYADAIRHDVGIATMTVGAVTTPDQVNTIVAAGRADIVALGRVHMIDSHFTIRAAAHYGWAGQRWPVQYGPGKDLAMRLFERDNADLAQLREAAKPSTHRR